MSIELSVREVEQEKRKKEILNDRRTETICDFTRPAVKKPRLDRKEEPIS
ncbi:MAG: hypothetical protein SPL89_01720 [Clostridia bacterium]|nr:hypothetical protein [Clostridia bacterium]